MHFLLVSIRGRGCLCLFTDPRLFLPFYKLFPKFICHLLGMQRALRILLAPEPARYLPLVMQQRGIRQKPYPICHPRYRKAGIPNYDWKEGRRDKVLRIKLPDFYSKKEKDDESFEANEFRDKLKQRGFAPVREWHERPIYMPSSNVVIEAYIPPEGDGKASKLTKEVSKLIKAFFFNEYSLTLPTSTTYRVQSRPFSCLPKKANHGSQLARYVNIWKILIRLNLARPR